MKKIICVLVLLFCFSCTGSNNLKINYLPELEKSYTASQEWMKNNFNQKGIFNYKYFSDKDTYSSKNNMIRQLMMSRILGKLSIDNENYREMHKKNLEFIFKNWYKENGNYGYVYYSNKSKLGANAMLLRVLVYSPFFEEYKEKAYKIANTIDYMQKKDGSFMAWYIEPNYDYDEDYLLTFYSGEALLSIVEFYKKTGEEKYLNMAKLSANYYIKKYVEEIEKNYYPAYVPWHTLALNELYKISKDKKYSHAIFILNNRLIEIQNKDKESKYYGRFYNSNYPQYGSPHSSSDSVYTEGVIYAYEIALLEKEEYYMSLYKEAIDSAFDNLFDLQYKDYNNKKLYGALKYNEDNFTIRVDTTSHFMDAVGKYLELK